MLYVSWPQEEFCHMIKKKKKGNGSYTALFLPDTSVYWGPGGGGGALFQVREVWISQTPDVKASAQTDFCLRLQKLKPVFYHNYL